MASTDTFEDGRKRRLPWQATLGAGIFSTHEFLRFCFDWGHDTRFRITHGAALALLWLGWGLLGTVPLFPKQRLALVQVFATSLPIYASLCTPASGGPWGPFKALVGFALLVPVAIIFGVLVRVGLSAWLRRRARFSPRQARAVDNGYLLACFPASAALQFVTGSWPVLLLGMFWEHPAFVHVWEHPAFVHEGVGRRLWTVEVVAWGISLVGWVVWFFSQYRGVLRRH